MLWIIHETIRRSSTYSYFSFKNHTNNLTKKSLKKKKTHIFELCFIEPNSILYLQWRNKHWHFSLVILNASWINFSINLLNTHLLNFIFLSFWMKKELSFMQLRIRMNSSLTLITSTHTRTMMGHQNSLIYEKPICRNSHKI